MIKEKLKFHGMLRIWSAGYGLTARPPMTDDPAGYTVLTVPEPAALLLLELAAVLHCSATGGRCNRAGSGKIRRAEPC